MEPVPPRQNALHSLWSFVSRLLTDSSYFLLLAALVIAGDVVLTQLIVRFIPCQLTVTWLPIAN